MMEKEAKAARPMSFDAHLNYTAGMEDKNGGGGDGWGSISPRGGITDGRGRGGNGIPESECGKLAQFRRPIKR